MTEQEAEEAREKEKRSMGRSMSTASSTGYRPTGLNAKNAGILGSIRPRKIYFFGRHCGLHANNMSRATLWVEREHLRLFTNQDPLEKARSHYNYNTQ